MFRWPYLNIDKQNDSQTSYKEKHQVLYYFPYQNREGKKRFLNVMGMGVLSASMFMYHVDTWCL